MKNTALKIASFIFLTTFIFIKVGSLHSYTHFIDDDNNIENCQFCEFYNANEEIATLVPPITTIPEKPVVLAVVKKVFFVDNNTFLDTARHGKYFNKPPPSYT